MKDRSIFVASPCSDMSEMNEGIAMKARSNFAPTVTFAIVLLMFAFLAQTRIASGHPFDPGEVLFITRTLKSYGYFETVFLTDKDASGGNPLVCTPGQNTWTGLGSTNNWSEAANWSCSHAPTTNENVIFDATSSRNSTIDVSTTALSLTITSGYSGSISVANTLNVTFTSASSIDGGTFTNGNGTLTFNGSFTISGGTFNAPSGNLTIANNFSFNGGSFFHNNGTVTFTGSNSLFGIEPAEMILNNVTINKSNGSNVAIFPQTDRLARVTGTLTLTEGAINGNTGSAFRAEGPVSIASTFGEPTLTAPTINNGILLLQNGNGPRTITFPAGATLPNIVVDDTNVSINGAGTGAIRTTKLTLRRGVVDLGATGLISGAGSVLCVEQTGGSFSIGSGNFLCNAGFALSQPDNNNPSTFTLGSGSFTLDSIGRTFLMTGGTFNASSSTNTINTGEFNNTMTVSGGTFNGNGTFDCICSQFILSGGTYNASNGVSTFRRNFNHTSGTFDPKNGTVMLTSTPGGGLIGDTTFYNLNVNFSGNNHNISDATLTVLGDLKLQSGEIDSPGGEFDVKGAVTVESSFAGANTDVKFSGSADQVFTNNGGVNPHRGWRIDKPSGRVILGSDMDLSNSGLIFYLTSGIVQTGSHLLDLGNRSVLGSGFGSNSYVIGNMRRQFPGGFQDITRRFDLGTDLGYAPVNVRVPITPGPTSGTLTPLTVSSRSTAHPFLDPASSVGGYWVISEGSGLLSADVTFTYPQAAVFGNESNYSLYRINNGEVRIIPSSLFISTNTATVNSTNDFTGEWAIGERPPQLQLNGPSPLVANAGDLLAFSAVGGRPPYTFTLVENNSGAALEQVSPEQVNYVAGQTFGVTDKLRLTDTLGTTIDAVISVVDPFTVLTNSDSGAGSLRRAIINANNTPGVQTISFNFPGNGPHSIAPFSVLPEITDPVIIDATTQPGYSGSPLVELTGINAGSGAIGLRIFAGNSTIKGLAINKWSLDAISLLINGNNVIAANYLGTDVTGTVAKPNKYGITVISNNNKIGGSTESDRNIISGNSTGGIIGVGNSNLIQGNYVGTNAAGNVAVPNAIGVILNGTNAAVGGAAQGEGNLISGNSGDGIEIRTGSHTIRGNVIGRNASGSSAIPNNGFGIDIDLINDAPVSNTTIGGIGQGEGNTIRSNGAAGIRIRPSQNKFTIRGNSIAENGGLGIDLGQSGISANTNCDFDFVQNAPVLSGVEFNASNTVVNFTLNSREPGTYTIDFYSSDDADPSGFGEGKTYIGSTVVSLSQFCDSFPTNANLPVQLTSGSVISATATDANGNTSEFSNSLGGTNSISGTIFNGSGNTNPAANTTVELRDPSSKAVIRTSMTGSTGRFSFSGLNSGAQYLVVPKTLGHRFEPPSRSYTLNGPADDEWHKFENGTLKISGRATLDGIGLGNVTMTLTNGPTTETMTTSLNGNYEFNELPAGTYTITPSLEGHTFEPFSKTVNISSFPTRIDGIANFVVPVSAATLKGRILFLSGGNVKAINANGSGEMTLLNTSETFKSFAISPEGNKIVTLSTKNGLGRIRTFNADSTGMSGVLLQRPAADLGNQGSVGWSSPIGSFIVFDDKKIFQGQSVRRLFRITFQGNALTEIGSTSFDNRTSPDWSPDGLSIIFRSESQFSSIQKIAFDGSSTTTLATSSQGSCFPQLSSVSKPKWSFDGNLIAFSKACAVSPGAPSGPSGIIVANADGSNQVRVNSDTEFDWSPNAARIALNSNGSLVAIGADGSDPIFIRQSVPSRLHWGRDNSIGTPAGTNTAIQTGSVLVSFNTTSGVDKTTTVTPIPPGSAGTVPGGFNIGNMAFEISTTANYTPPILVCFNIPSNVYQTQAAFNTLALLHNENGILVDRTFTRVFTDRVVCGVVDSLSPFALAETVDPAMASVRGLVIDQNGEPLRDLVVSVDGDESRFTTTSEDGLFGFTNLVPGGNYTVTPQPYGYEYDFADRSFNAITGENTIVFTARARKYSISGTIRDASDQPVEGTVVTLSGSAEKQTITDTNGFYLFDDLEVSGSYTVRPELGGNVISPEQVTVDNLQQDRTSVDFTAAQQQTAFSISGRAVTAEGRGIAKAFVTLSSSSGGSITTYTNSFGYYQFFAVSPDSYTIRVASKRFTFTDPERDLVVVSDLADVDFTASQ